MSEIPRSSRLGNQRTDRLVVLPGSYFNHLLHRRHPTGEFGQLIRWLRTRQFWDVKPLSSHTGDGMSVFFFTILLSVFISYYFLRKSSCFTHPKPYFLFFGHFLVRVRNNLFITSIQRTNLSLRSCLCSCNRRTSGGFCRTASIVPWSSVLKRVQSARELSGLPKRVRAV